MTGIIELEGMEFYAYHGCYAAEQLVGSKFRVDAEIRYDCALAARKDEIADALSYQTAYEVIAAEMRTVSHLLEHVAQRMIDALYARFPQAVCVRIRVSKLNPPLGGKVRSSSVTLEK